MVDPISALCLAACTQVVGAISVGTAAGGILGNRADWALNKLLERSLTHLAHSLGLPANHDLQKGLLAAHHRALAFTAETMSRQSRGVSDRIVAGKIAAMARRPVTLEANPFVSVELLTPLIAGRPDTNQMEFLNDAGAMLAAWLEHESGETLPAHFRALLTEAAPDGRASWVTVLRVLIAEEIKTQPRFANIFLAENVAEIAGRTEQIQAIAAEMQRGLSQLCGELQLIATDVRQVLTNQVEQQRHNQRVSDFITMAMASGAFEQAAAHGISEAAVRRIVEKLGGEGLAPSDLLTWLDTWIESARLELGRTSNEGLAFDMARQAAERRFLAGAQEDVADPLMELLNREAEESQRRQQRLIEEAIRFDMLALNISGAIDKFKRLALIIKIPVDRRSEWLTSKGRESYETGQSRADNGAMALSIELYRAALDAAPLQGAEPSWATIQNALGIALQALGSRLSTYGYLEDAATAYRASLQALSSADRPKQWADTVANLASVLLTLAERRADAILLEEAIDSLKLVAAQYQQGNMWSRFATAQNNLGLAYWILARIEWSSRSLADSKNALEEAIRIYRLDNQRDQIAMAASNLGNTLRMWSEIDQTADQISSALDAFDVAVALRDRDKAPLAWAYTLSSLGAAQCVAGVVTSDRQYFRSAVTSLNGALEELSIVRTPLDWCRSTIYLSWAAALLADRPQEVEAARVSILEARDVAIRSGHRLHVLAAERALASVAARRGATNDG